MIYPRMRKGSYRKGKGGQEGYHLTRELTAAGDKGEGNTGNIVRHITEKKQGEK
jgi:hypothetical protein